MSNIIVKANLNNYVYFRLTERGELLVKQGKLHLAGAGCVKEAGLLKMQMWAFMRQFGPFMDHAVEPVEMEYRVEVDSASMVGALLTSD